MKERREEDDRSTMQDGGPRESATETEDGEKERHREREKHKRKTSADLACARFQESKTYKNLIGSFKNLVRFF